jgi:hypothetical protein
MHHFLLGLFMLAAPIFAAAPSSADEPFVWHEKGEPIEDRDHQKARGGFGAMLLLIDDPKFFEDWKKPEPPTLKRIDKAKRMVPVHAAILFGGPATNSAGNAHVLCDVKVLKPDGTTYGEQTGLIGHKSKIASQKHLMLAIERLVVRIEPHDPAGTYTVQAVVRDKIRNVDLELKQQFTVE